MPKSMRPRNPGRRRLETTDPYLAQLNREREERIATVRSILKRHEIGASVKYDRGTASGFINVSPPGSRDWNAEEKRRLRALFGYAAGNSYTFNPQHPDYGRRDFQHLKRMDVFLSRK